MTAQVDQAAIDAYLQQRNEDRRFQAWRRRVQRGIPPLAARVFALRSSFYSGCGGHWAMERDLGVIIAQIHDYDRSFDVCARIGLEVRVEALHRSVREAEASALALSEGEK